MSVQNIYHPDSLRQTLGEPAQWPRGVETRLLAVVSTLRAGLPLKADEARFLARYFVFPNLVRWIFKLRQRTQAAPYIGECPIHGGPRDCADAPFEVPAASAAGDRLDWCRGGEPQRPWELQIVLLWNNYQRLKNYATAPQQARREYPSGKCAREVYRRVVDQPAVRKRWSVIDDQPRPPQVVEAWKDLIGALDETLNWISALEWPKLMDQLLAKDVPQRLARLGTLASQTLSDWMAKQEAAANPLTAQILGASQPLLTPLVRRLRVTRQPLPTGPLQQDITAFLRMLDQVEAPHRPMIHKMLGQPVVGLSEQKELLLYMEKELIPLRRRGRPTGDPLDDPLIHDVFWQRVGAAGPTPFVFRTWCLDHWTAVGPAGEEKPRWTLLN